MNPVLWLGWKRRIQTEDVPSILAKDESRLLGDQLEAAWKKEKKLRKKDAKLLNAIFVVFRKEYFETAVLLCIEIVFK